MAVFVAAPNAVSAKENKKKEKKKYEWDWDKTKSGNEYVDNYLLAVDTVWYQMQKLDGLVDTYSYKEDTICVNRKYYVAAHMEDSKGCYVTRGTVNWQFVETTMTSANIVLAATAIGLQTATATTALPQLGLKAFSYGKYIKAGPKILGFATTGVKDVWKKTRAQSKRWLAMKRDSVDPTSIGVELTEKQKEVFSKCVYIIEINNDSEDYTVINDIYTNKTEEQIKQEQEEYLNALASTSILPSEDGKLLDNLDDSELDKYSL